MKTMHSVFLVMIAAVFLLEASLGQQADHPSQPAISASSEQSGHQQKAEVRNDKDEPRSKKADGNQEQPADMARPPAKHRSNVYHTKPAPTYRALTTKKPRANSPRVDGPGSAATPAQMSVKPYTDSPNQVVNRQSRSAPSSARLVNGQQYRNSHNPGAHLAASGGPAAKARGTAINGTDMKRKP